MGKVLILDEHVLVAQLLREELAQEGHHVLISTDSAEAVAAIPLFAPDILIMDPFLTKRAKWDVLSQLKSLRNEMVVIIYTAHQGLAKDPHMKMASAFVLKRSSMEEIKALVDKGAPVSNAASASLEIKVADGASREAKPFRHKKKNSAQEKVDKGGFPEKPPELRERKESLHVGPRR